MNQGDIDNRFKFHPATTNDRAAAHEAVRADGWSLASAWNETLPEGREKALAITKIEEAVMWANASIARN